MSHMTRSLRRLLLTGSILMAVADVAQAETITWTGAAANGSWHTASNWNLSRVPAAGDDVIIPNLPGTSSVTFDSGTTSIASLTCSEVFILSAGSLSLEAASALDLTFTMSGGTLTGAGAVTLNGTNTWSSGTMSGTGTTIIGSDSTLSITATGVQTFLNRILENNGLVTWTSGDLRANGGTINNYSVFRVNFSGTDLDLLAQSGTNLFSNFGTFVKLGSGAVHFRSMPFDNISSVQVATGILELAAGGVSSGSFTLAASTRMQLLGAHEMNAGSAFSGAGTLAITEGTSTFNGTTFTDIHLAVSGGNAIVNSSGNFGGLALSGMPCCLPGILSGSGSLTFHGTSTWALGTMSGTGRTIIGPTGTLAIALSSAGQTFLNRTLENNGTVNWTSGDLRANGGTVNNNSQFTINAGTALDFLDTSGINSFNNAGTLTKQGAGTVRLAFWLNNSGSVRAMAGVLDAAAGLTQTDGEIVLNGGSLSTSATITFQGGVLRGSGTITGNVSNTGGTVRPGLSPGSLSISGNFTQSTPGIIAIELEGYTADTQFDRLVVSGLATLGGRLHAALLNGFTPLAGDDFTFLTCGSRIGQFEPCPPDAVSDQVTYTATDATMIFGGNCTCVDGDGDGIAGCSDNCPGVANVNQLDADEDGIGDVCDCDGGGKVNPANGHSYRRSAIRYWGASDSTPGRTQPDWWDAEAEAISYGGHLVTINDAAENSWLITAFGTEALWIGLTDWELEGTFDWISGETIAYTNWDGGQPDNAHAGGEDSVHMNHGSSGRWNDLGEQGNSPFHPNPYYAIIERDTGDADHDGVHDGCDNCADIANSDQADGDNDGVGDACDNCPVDANPTQEDTDGDTQGDACEPDDDGDGIPDATDNCPLVSNANQANYDGDSEGDACDLDDDNDGIADGVDNCALVANSTQTDVDDDGVGDSCDICPTVFNDNQTDSDGDAIGDACDHCPGSSDLLDSDGDGVPDACDNCPTVPNPMVATMSSDGGSSSFRQPDEDEDGSGDACDNCEARPNSDQADANQNGLGDPCDDFVDTDGDGLDNDVDTLPTTPSVNFSWGGTNGTILNAPPGVTFRVENAEVHGSPAVSVSVAGVTTQKLTLDIPPSRTMVRQGNGYHVFRRGSLETFGFDGDLEVEFDVSGQIHTLVPGGDSTMIIHENVVNDVLVGVFMAAFDQTVTVDGQPLNPGQAVSIGTITPPDTDGDGVSNHVDNCPSLSNASQVDADGDGIGDDCDNCPSVPNLFQGDIDGDGVGNVCDACPNRKPGDVSGGGIVDPGDLEPFVAVLLNPNAATPQNFCATDVDGSGLPDGGDIQPMVNLLTSP